MSQSTRPTLSAARAPEGLRLVGVGALLVVSRIPYLLARGVQDDAFITWRCAVQLADTGVYGVNPGERVSASTSHAYVALVALLRLVFRGAYIPATLVANACILVGGLFLICDAVSRDRRVRDACWALAASSPVALVISTSGMETALLVFTFAIALHGLARSPPPFRAFAALALLPWVRLDATFAGAVLAVAYAGLARRIAVRAGLSLLAGLAAAAAFNEAYFGVLVNQSILAKLAGLHASHAPADILARVVGVYFTTGAASSVFMPLATRYLAYLGPPVAAASVLACGVLVRREPRGSAQRAAWLATAGVALLAPAIYAGAAVLYPWYFWPSLLLATVAILALALGEAARRERFRVTVASLGACTLLAAAGQWTLTYSDGLKEHAYTEGVGRFVASEEQPGDTLFSDMAGSIPYLAGVPTDDEWGLVSPRVTRFMAERGDAWEPAFLREVHPSWIVLRATLADRLGLAGADGADDRGWALAHYDLVRRFVYRPDDLVSNPLLLSLARLGSAPDFFVYRLRTTPGRPPPR